MRQPAKILHVMNNASGGAAISTLDLMRELRRAGIGSSAVCHAVGSREERQAILDATDGQTLFTVLYAWNRKFRTPMIERPLKELKQGVRTGWARRSARLVAGEAARTGADLIHTNTILNPEGGIAARALGLPHVWHLRELLGRGQWFRLPLEGRALGRFLAKRCSTLVANSHVAAAAVRDGLPRDLLSVVPNGIDLTAFDAAPRAGAEHPIVVAMVGNLGSHVKKHGVFIEAAARVRSARPVEFRIYGADPSAGAPDPAGFPYIAGLHSRIDRLGLAGRMHFKGFEPRPERIMRDIDILVHPCDLESFGRIAVEAMAASRPVVGVRGGGVAEVVEDGVTGLLAEPDDPQGIAACVSALCDDRDRRREMGRAGRRRAEAQYSLATHAARMLDVYRNAMARPLGHGLSQAAS